MSVDFSTMSEAEKERWFDSQSSKTDSGGSNRTREKDYGSEAMKDLVGDNQELSAAYGKLNNAIEKFAKVGGASFPLLDRTMTMANRKYDPIMEQLGGLAEINNILNESSEVAFDQINFIYRTHLGETNKAVMESSGLMVERNGEMRNSVNLFYKDASDVARNYMKVRNELAQRQGLMLNQLSEADATQIGMMEKGLQITNSKVADLLERQISLTGEASDKIFNEIGAYADAVAQSTGVSFQEISGQIADIVTDVERFGNVQVDEAARIAGALNQLGLSYKGFGGMIDKFMNFDSAAESLGNLTTVFGVHFDAMEMMQLANEDQEEFLYRMREAFLDSGKAVEDMTLAEKKLAAQQMGMSIQDFENFMQEDRLLDASELAAATADADPEDGFQKISENMKLVERDAGDMERFMQNKIMDPLSTSAKAVGDDFQTMKSHMMVNAQEFLPGYTEMREYMHGMVKGALGTEEFGKYYPTLLQDIKAHVLTNLPGTVIDEDLLVKEIDALEKKFQDDPNFTMNMSELLQLGMSKHGGTEFSSYIGTLIKDGLNEGYNAANFVVQEHAKDLESGIDGRVQVGVTIDPEYSSEHIKERMDLLAEQVRNKTKNNKIIGQSESEYIGRKIREGITFDVDKTAEHLRQKLNILAEKVKPFAENILDPSSTKDAKLELNVGDTLVEMQDLNNKAIFAAQNSQKEFGEKMELLNTNFTILSKVIEKNLTETKNIENKVYFNGKMIAEYIRDYQTGFRFKTVTADTEAT